MRRSRIGAVVALAALAWLVPSCQRKPQFVPATGDSTAVGSPDSASVRLRRAQEQWESGPDDSAAAEVARALADRLAAEPSTHWKERVEALLDSLGIGGEAAEADCLVGVNLFSRADPTGGSWPYLFWCADQGPLYQPIEGGGVHLLGVVARGKATGNAGRMAGMLTASRAISGEQPLLTVWQLPPSANRWRLVQTLGPDSLGGVGSGEFESDADTAVELVTRTYRTPRYFEECPTCPHMYRLHRFHWGALEFERTERSVVASPYATFVQFIQALMADDRASAAAFSTGQGVLDQAIRLGWGMARGAWRVAPGMDESPTRMIFFRGEQEAYAVHFAQQGQGWMVAGIEAVPRTLE